MSDNSGKWLRLHRCFGIAKDKVYRSIQLEDYYKFELLYYIGLVGFEDIGQVVRFDLSEGFEDS